MISRHISDIIPKIQRCMSSLPIDKAWLFGSCSRGEEKAGSDIDILVKYTDSDSLSLLSICRMRKQLEKSINMPVDLIEDGCLQPFAQKSANADKILIYERAN